MKDYYYILGVKSNSTEKEIKSAYRKLSLKFHPDKNEGDKFFEERFKEINEAYEILGDIQKRKKYDEGSQNKSEKEYSSSKQEPPEPEIVYFRVNKSSIKKGEILEVSWETKFANSIKILPFGVLEASGTKRFKINGDDSFQCKILASNGNKVVSKEISITVTKIQPNPTAPIILTFESDKVIADEDGFIELTWQTTNATRVEIEGLGIVPLSGSAKFNTKLKVNFNRPVSLTARNEFGSVIKSIKIYKKETQPVAESNSSFIGIFIIVILIFGIIISTIKSEPKAITTIPVDMTIPVDTTAFVDTALTDSDNFTNSNSPQIDPVNSQIEGRTEKKAEFPNNGLEGFGKFITDNFEIPSHGKNITANGKIFVEFEITTTGDNEIKFIYNNLKFNEDISIENKNMYTKKCDVAVKVLFSKMPKWIPGEKDGQFIISRFTIPINIRGN